MPGIPAARFVLRIEDTDKARNTAEATQAIYDGLRWLGLDWDEGPQVAEITARISQSEREAVYQRYLDRLQAAGFVYEEGGRRPVPVARERSPGRPYCGDIEIDNGRSGHQSRHDHPPPGWLVDIPLRQCRG